MTDIEYDVLDELYFLQSYKELEEGLKLSNKELHLTLANLLKKGWIKCYAEPTAETALDISELEKDYWNYHYLATKAGLLAHNSNF